MASIIITARTQITAQGCVIQLIITRVSHFNTFAQHPLWRVIIKTQTTQLSLIDTKQVNGAWGGGWSGPGPIQSFTED
ncbi:hypothetical protein BAE46_04565 [Glaciecola punicea]|uniref:hypothetical protein n=1 Tax=Glaciecola punicea TaxID=56804 RepID=UPI00087257D6|nr:hypothetical protein [Glaciecola punicea]OFA32306.1 hypothetical protein BAE46_04565 [Glaciecola punicea]